MFIFENSCFFFQTRLSTVLKYCGRSGGVEDDVQQGEGWTQQFGDMEVSTQPLMERVLVSAGDKSSLECCSCMICLLPFTLHKSQLPSVGHFALAPQSRTSQFQVRRDNRWQPPRQAITVRPPPSLSPELAELLPPGSKKINYLLLVFISST